jgi:hypothetical protein
VGTVLEVEVRLRGSAIHRRLPGTVRWSLPAPRRGFLFGMSFDGVGPEEQALLDRVVEEFRRRAGSIE